MASTSDKLSDTRLPYTYSNADRPLYASVMGQPALADS